MSWQPTTSQKTRQLRARMLHDIRVFFLARNVLEVETPALSQAGNTDPFIESIQTRRNTDLRYLHTSPEYAMKRLLADGSGDIYQTCKVWRAGESGKNHNPEFTMLEWYRVNFSYLQLINEVSELLKALLPKVDKQHRILTYKELFINAFGINPHVDNPTALANCIEKRITGLDTANLNQQAMLDALLTHCIEPSFDKHTLTFIIDYPSSQSALAQTRHEKEKGYRIAERFEVYLGCHELGNGYQEETSFEQNKTILDSENKQRQQMKLNPVKKDAHFLQAMKAGMPKSAGVAIGLDRILMKLTDVDDIQDVINFPWERA